MVNRRTEFTNAYESQSAAILGDLASSLSVLDASSLAVPCYLVIDPDNPAAREFVYASAKAGNVLTVSERYLAGSAALSGLTHASNTVVRSAATAQGFTDLHDRADAIVTTVATLPHSALGGLTVGNDHTQYLLTTAAAATYSLLGHTHLKADITDLSLDWAEITGKPATFTPSAHVHAGEDITTGTVAAARIAALDASKITTGTFDVLRIPALPASQVTSGTFDVLRIPSLPASQITSGAFADARIPSLAASKITTGTFAIARIPTGETSTTVSLGNHNHSGQLIIPSSITTGALGVQGTATVQGLDVTTLQAILAGGASFGNDLTFGAGTGRVIGLAAGTVASPSIRSNLSGNTGIFFGGTNDVRIATASANAFRVTNTQIWAYSAASTANSGLPSWRVGTDNELLALSSSARYKTNILRLVPFDGLNEIMRLRPVSFQSTIEGDDPSRTNLGFIAEEVYEVLPEVVALDAEGRPDSLSYEMLTPSIVSAIQELEARIVALESA